MWSGVLSRWSNFRVVLPQFSLLLMHWAKQRAAGSAGWLKKIDIVQQQFWFMIFFFWHTLYVSLYRFCQHVDVFDPPILPDSCIQYLTEYKLFICSAIRIGKTRWFYGSLWSCRQMTCSLSINPLGHIKASVHLYMWICVPHQQSFKRTVHCASGRALGTWTLRGRGSTRPRGCVCFCLLAFLGKETSPWRLCVCVRQKYGVVCVMQPVCIMQTKGEHDAINKTGLQCAHRRNNLFDTMERDRGRIEETV